MRNEQHDTEQPLASLTGLPSVPASHIYHLGSRESMLAALALLLGPETDETIRKRAAQRLAKRGATWLPLILTTLNQYPEITTPSWPHWPPQYEPCCRLLIQLCKQTHHSLETLLAHPVLARPIGPVLTISAIEAAHLLPSLQHELLIREGLTSPWTTVRYAAAMALVHLAGTNTLQKATLDTLHENTREKEDVPVRLTCAFALMRSNDNRGFPALMRLIESNIPDEARKACIFLLATEPPSYLNSLQQEHLTQLLFAALQDPNGEIALHSAHALRTIAQPSILPSLCLLLTIAQPQLQIATLTALEELASRPEMRRAILHSTLPSRMNVLLRAEVAEVRRQACYALAACGDVYAATALGTALLNQGHPAQAEAAEAIRLLRNALHAPTRTRVVDWLLHVLSNAHIDDRDEEKGQEEFKISILDSLAFLAWQAQKQSRKQALLDISREVFRDELPLRLLTCKSAWVRQRTIELLGLLIEHPQAVQNQLMQMLHMDEDSGVRACCAYTLGQLTARYAIPDLLCALGDTDRAVAETALLALCRIATAEDAIVVAVLRELAQYGCLPKQKKERLANIARKQLKHWRYQT